METFKLTTTAEKFVRRMLRMSGLEGRGGFRLLVKGGGCIGVTADFSVEPEPIDGDQVIEVKGLTFFVPPESLPLLEGTILHYAESPTSSVLMCLVPKPVTLSTCATV
ncbi:HesB/IscA family protein [Tepidiphilus baoligensis]|uniref:Core domain-containing protein n=1 Tax=Tepidiphilus baoligensis TaxID=2698687 RepID=A0ABX1QLY4_9PROT|nr:iron-sulfur cluster biosynthesis family protein [Tepidiphilus baoligensis]NMH16224.1 hypothetical protein [Tepidiphilus baoligensis]